MGVSSVETCNSYECNYEMSGVLYIYICLYIYIYNEHTHWRVYFCSGSLIFNALHSFHGLQVHLFHFIMDWDLLISTHWGRATHICVGKLTTIGSDNGLSPGRRQAIIWTNAGILLIGSWGTNFSEILVGIQTFSLKKMHLKMSFAKWRPFVSASMCKRVTAEK